MYTYIMTKVISIADDAYDYLKSLKSEKESFSKIIKRLVPKRKKSDLLKLAGSLKDKKFENTMKKIIKNRSKIKFDSPKF